MKLSIHDAQLLLQECLDAAQDRDDEAAHVWEDRLHRLVIMTIASGNAEDPKALAEIAARTKRIVFQRGFA